jgi:hypothetical protein
MAILMVMSRATSETTSGATSETTSGATSGATLGMMAQWTSGVDTRSARADQQAVRVVR